jgi:hypothetical protein
MQTMGFEAAEIFQLAATLCRGGEEGRDKLNPSHCEGWDKLDPTGPSGENMMEQPGEDQPSIWHAAAARLVNLSARPAIERTMVQPNIILLDNKNKVFWMVGPCGKENYPKRVMLDSGAQPLMLGRAAFHGLGMKKSNVDKCPFQIQTSVGA